MVPGDKMCPQHQLLGPMSFLLMKLSVTHDEFLCSFFLSLSFILPFRLDLPFFSPFSVALLFFSNPFLFPDWYQKVPDQLVAPASCEKPFYVLLQVIWRGAFSLSTRALICSRFFPITLQPCATWFCVSQREIFFIFLSLTVASRCTFLFKRACCCTRTILSMRKLILELRIK